MAHNKHRIVLRRESEQGPGRAYTLVMGAAHAGPSCLVADGPLALLGGACKGAYHATTEKTRLIDYLSLGWQRAVENVREAAARLWDRPAHGQGSRPYHPGGRGRADQPHRAPAGLRALQGSAAPPPPLLWAEGRLQREGHAISVMVRRAGSLMPDAEATHASSLADARARSSLNSVGAMHSTRHHPTPLAPHCSWQLLARWALRECIAPTS